MSEKERQFSNDFKEYFHDLFIQAQSEKGREISGLFSEIKKDAQAHQLRSEKFFTATEERMGSIVRDMNVLAESVKTNSIDIKRHDGLITGFKINLTNTIKMVGNILTQKEKLRFLTIDRIFQGLQAVAVAVILAKIFGIGL